MSQLLYPIGAVEFDWDDITWCSSKCKNTDCFRNPVNMRHKTGLHSWADFKGNGECPEEKINN